MIIRRILGLSLCLGLLAGCSLHQRPAVSASTPDFDSREVIQNADIATAQTANAPQLSQWWAHLGVAQMEPLVQQVWERNFDLRRTALRLQQLVTDARMAGAALQPGLDASLGVQRREVADGPQTRISETLSGSLSASWEIDLWGRLGATAEAARQQVRSTEQDWRVLRLSLAAETSLAALDIASARAGTRLQQQLIDLDRQDLQLQQQRFARGLVPLGDIYDVQTRLNQAERNLTNWQQQDANARARLQKLGGFAQDSQFRDWIPPLDSFEAPAPASIRAVELLKRPEVQRDLAQLRAADQQVAAAVSEQYPRISLSASLESSGTSADDLLQARNAFWSLLGNLVQPLLDGGRRRLQAESRQLAYEQQLLQYRDTLMGAFVDVQSALELEAAARRAHRLVQQQLAQWQREVELVQVRVGSGTAPVRQLVLARRNLLATRIERLQAHSELIQRVIARLRTTATGIEAPASALQGASS